MIQLTDLYKTITIIKKLMFENNQAGHNKKNFGKIRNTDIPRRRTS